ncbi:MAG: HAMP domain-containing histidine kinase [Nostoc sp. NMS1]|uniref:sensor histidine kinase n=1 Tax=unclassified Nostoc TaxID=2593658 RepID=UPI0025F045EB|nr:MULTISPECIES: ATP-binding protein [unclassified Nostoc]MBN3908638.1 HAMP domain-containing histidine kinase [Nostoc sp. NMS1]MBN3992111.1 HAMP domain-containing histidine kinase [Nostoc sp. NMS2]
MEFVDYQQEIKELKKANRILQKQLERSEVDRVKLEETNEKKEYLLRKVIGELKEYQNNLEKRSHELEMMLLNLQIMQNKMSSLGSLVADVAHEINNPVGFIAGNLTPAQEYIQNLLHLIELYQKTYPQASQEIQEIIKEMDLEYVRKDLPKLISSMREGTNRISSISNSLRTFSRADTEQKVMFNLHEGIDNTLLILKHRLKDNNTRPAIQVVRNYGDLPLLLCFPGQLNQVFMNLLANAIDALDEANSGLGFDEIKKNPNQIIIDTAPNKDKNHVLIKIQDNGVGISADIQQKMFEHLFTTKSVGKGTGLGLSIAYQIIVQKHRGTLEVKSVLGKGSEFIISIPLS